MLKQNKKREKNKKIIFIKNKEVKRVISIKQEL